MEFHIPSVKSPTLSYELFATGIPAQQHQNRKEKHHGSASISIWIEFISIVITFPVFRRFSVDWISPDVKMGDSLITPAVYNSSITKRDIIMKTLSILTKSLCCLVLIGGAASADIAVNIDPGRNSPNAPDTTLNDFLTLNPGSGLTASSTFLNSVGNAGGSTFGQNFTSPGTTVGNFVVTAGRNNGVVGSGIELDAVTGDPLNASDSGFNAGDASHNDLAPITEGYVFNAAGHFVSIDGLLANSNAGDTIILSTWGIGDNVGQDSDFTATYGSSTATQSTFYNNGGARGDATGSVPFVNFTFTADGLTDQIRFDIINSGQLNAFSLAVIPAIPEPSSVALLAGSLFGIGLRRRRRK